MTAMTVRTGRSSGRAVCRWTAAALLPLLATACDAAAPAASGAVKTVSGPVQLQAALLTAKGGTEIRLQPGDYGELSLRGKKFEGQPLTLIAATDKRPVFTKLTLDGASGIVVAGVQVSGLGRPLVGMSNASNIVFAGNLVTGANHNQDPWDDNGVAAWIRFSRHMTIAGNIFEDFRGTAYFQQTDRATFADNTVRHVREGLNVAASTNLDLMRNYFHSFSPKFMDREHPDSIQFWTAREKIGSSNVRIVENVMMHGLCGAIQGIFIRSETTGNPKAPQIYHDNFLVQRNVYYGASKHGVTVTSVHGSVVENNVVVASPWSLSGIKRADAQAKDPRCSGALQPAILTRFGPKLGRG